MSSNKLAASKDFEHHIRNLLEFQEMKSQGFSDRKVCKKLGVGFSTLQRYKGMLAELQLDQLSEEYLKEKKLEMDDQVQGIVGKLYEVISLLESNHHRVKGQLDKVIQGLDSDDPKQQEKIFKLTRFTNYPVKDVSEIMKLLLEAVNLRSKVWLSDQVPDMASTRPKKVIINIDNKPIKKDMHKLNAIADQIVGQIEEKE